MTNVCFPKVKTRVGAAFAIQSLHHAVKWKLKMILMKQFAEISTGTCSSLLECRDPFKRMFRGERGGVGMWRCLGVCRNQRLRQSSACKSRPSISPRPPQHEAQKGRCQTGPSIKVYMYMCIYIYTCAYIYIYYIYLYMYVCMHVCK